MNVKLNTHEIKIIMAERQMSNVELAATCGFSRQNVSTILRRGTCALKTVGKLASGLNIPVESIMKEGE